MSPHVDDIVRLFVRKEKRERILALAAKASRQSDFRGALLHDTRSLNPRVMRRLPASGSIAEDVLSEMPSRRWKGRPRPRRSPALRHSGGMTARTACDHLRAMHRPNRIPTLLARVYRLARVTTGNV